MQFSFALLSQQNNTRVGEITTSHGVIKTPMFMPVGTVGSVKSLSSEDVINCGADILLGNTYHLYLRPGDEFIRDYGGLHTFMNWQKPILTDSGGFQALSLSKVKSEDAGISDEPQSKLAQITEEGVKFRSHIDGSYHFLTPEKSIQIQLNLGSDIIMAFDEADPSSDKAYAKAAMERTHRWLIRSKDEWLKGKAYGAHGTLFGIIQGGLYEDLRKESAKFVTDLDLPGVALGGTSIGSDPQETEEVMSWIKEYLPQNKPIYAMGVGTKPTDIITVIQAGADIFDCVAPTRLARTGYLYHGNLIRSNGRWKFESEFPHERLDIKQAKWKTDAKPIQEDCDCYTCQSGYSKAYLHHLFKNRELLYYRLASIHNVRTMIRVCEELRQSLLGS